MGTEATLTKMTNMRPFIREGAEPPPSAAADVPNAVSATAEELANVFEPGSIKVLTELKGPLLDFYSPTVVKGGRAPCPRVGASSSTYSSPRRPSAISC